MQRHNRIFDWALAAIIAGMAACSVFFFQSIATSSSGYAVPVDAEIVTLLRAPALSPIAKPAVADSAWAIVNRCTEPLGFRTRPKADLRDVKWFKAHLLDPSQIIVAFFRPPDTVVLDPHVLNEVAIVAHELMHVKLGGPPSPPHDPHPFVPFASCGLMAWQLDSLLPDGRIRLRSGTILVPSVDPK